MPCAHATHDSNPNCNFRNSSIRHEYDSDFQWIFNQLNCDRVILSDRLFKLHCSVAINFAPDRLIVREFCMCHNGTEIEGVKVRRERRERCVCNKSQTKWIIFTFFYYFPWNINTSKTEIFIVFLQFVITPLKTEKEEIKGKLRLWKTSTRNTGENWLSSIHANDKCVVWRWWRRFASLIDVKVQEKVIHSCQSGL